jgi:hypothetical protein
MKRSSAFHIIPHWISDVVLFCLGEGIAVRSLLHLQPLDQKIGGQNDHPQWLVQYEPTTNGPLILTVLSWPPWR